MTKCNYHPPRISQRAKNQRKRDYDAMQKTENKKMQAVDLSKGDLHKQTN